jgi:hypothetical protein
MEITYQTPKLSQFHIGFRYERRNSDNTWTKAEFTTKDNLAYFETCLNDGTFRTKSLDHYDIKEAGWEFSYEDNFKYFKSYRIKGFILNIINNTNSITITNDFWLDGYSKLFQGTVKNYNKLLDVMGMLGIKLLDENM